MSDHEIKVELKPVTTAEALDALSPMVDNGYGYGTQVRKDRYLRLRKTSIVEIDYQQEIVSTTTLWMIERVSEASYQRKVEESLGHLHTDAKGKVVGFCPNESLSFTKVNQLIAQLTQKETVNAR